MRILWSNFNCIDAAGGLGNRKIIWQCKVLLHRLISSNSKNIVWLNKSQKSNTVVVVLMAAHDACKGSDSSVDFDCVRIDEEKCQTLTLKNKGKFDIGYAWVLQFCACYIYTCIVHCQSIASHILYALLTPVMLMSHFMQSVSWDAHCSLYCTHCLELCDHWHCN